MRTTIIHISWGVLLFLLGNNLEAQSPVTSYQAVYTTASSSTNSYIAFPASIGTFLSCIGSNYTYTWSNGTSNELKLTSFSANAKTYIVSGVSGVQVKLRRVNNLNVIGSRHIMYSESTASSATACPAPATLNFKAPYEYDMASFLNNNVLNRGTDNVFTNSGNGDGNNNNIERVDVVIPMGVSASIPADAGFILCERGNNNAHDGFRIAAILSIDGSNNPTSFGAVKTCVAGNGSNNGSWGHPPISGGNKLLAAYVMRKDPLDLFLRVSSNVNQEIGGVYFSLADLGVAANQHIYGYALIGPDGTANPTSAQLLNTSDGAVYPTGTTEAQGGGLDLVAVNTFFGTSMVLSSGAIRSFDGVAKNAEAIMSWKLDQLTEGTPISLQRSTDGSSFFPVYNYLYGGVNSFREKLSAGTYYYRLQVQNSYSRIITLQITDPSALKIYPTLLKSTGTVTIEGLPPGNYKAILSSTAGHRYYLDCKVQSATTIELKNKKLGSGVYFLSFYKNGTEVGRVHKIIISE